MNDAEVYSRANIVQLEGAKQLLAEYAHQIDWEVGEGRAKLLDIGCRNGDILVDVLLPHIPRKLLESVIAVDISKEMVREARRRHGTHRKVSFTQYDIEGKSCKILQLFGPYSHVTSFFWLDWVHNQRQAYTNIFNLLKPGGRFFAIFILKHGLVPVYQELEECSKFGMFLKNWWEHVPAYCMDTNWRPVLLNHLTTVGFREIHIEHKPHLVAHLPSEEMMKESLQTLDYFHRRIPPKFRQEYMDELFRLFKSQLVPRRPATDHAYDVIVLHAIKPEP